MRVDVCERIDKTSPHKLSFSTVIWPYTHMIFKRPHFKAENAASATYARLVMSKFTNKDRQIYRGQNKRFQGKLRRAAGVSIDRL